MNTQSRATTAYLRSITLTLDVALARRNPGAALHLVTAEALSSILSARQAEAFLVAILHAATLSHLANSQVGGLNSSQCTGRYVVRIASKIRPVATSICCRDSGCSRHCLCLRCRYHTGCSLGACWLRWTRGDTLSLTPSSWWVATWQFLQDSVDSLGDKVGDIAAISKVAGWASVNALVHTQVTGITIVDNLLQDILIPASNLA